MAEHRQTSGTERIHQTGSQCRLGTHHRQVDMLLAGELQQTCHVGVLQVDIGSDGSGARIAGSAENLAHLRRTMQRIRNGMFTTTSSDD